MESEIAGYWASEVLAACQQSTVDLNEGFDLFIETYKDGDPRMRGWVRQRVTANLLTYVAERMDAVISMDLQSVRTDRQPDGDMVASSLEEASYWALVIDDEAFCLAPDVGAPGATSITVHLVSLLDAIQGEVDSGLRWHEGSLLACNQDMEDFAERVRLILPRPDEQRELG